MGEEEVKNMNERNTAIYFESPSQQESFFFLHILPNKISLFFACKLLKAENDNNGLQINCNNAIDSRWNV